MIPNFFKVILAVLLVLEPAKAMMEEEESSKHTQTKLSQKKPSETKFSLSSVATIESLSNELLLYVFKFVEIPDLGRTAQVSNRWKRVAEAPGLWKYMGSQYYEDYLREEDLKENPKQKVISHYLSVMVNATESLEDIERLVHQYQLYLYIPFFKKCIETSFLTDLVTNLSNYEELIAQGNKGANERKFNGLLEGKYGYVKDLTAARELNELLIKRGNPKAVERKLESLTLGGVKVWITLASRGYQFPTADVRYAYEIVPLYGDVKDLKAAREFNELLIEKGDPEAIKRKIWGLAEGKYGYVKDLTAARELNELLIEKDDPEAIKRKIRGLAEGEYGYLKDLTAARELNELLIERGNPKAIKRKIYGLVHGANGYERTLKVAREFNDLLAEGGDLEAIARKMIGLECQEYGYEQDLVTARKLNDLLVERGNLKAIKRTLTRLVSRYKADPKAVEFIESLIVCEFPIARGIGKYIKALAMKYGIVKFGYEKNREEAFKFIKENYVPY